MVSSFKMIGLSSAGHTNPCNMTTTLQTEDDKTFWAITNISSELLKPLLNFCDYNWQVDKIAIVLHKGFNQGIPLNPVVIEIKDIVI